MDKLINCRNCQHCNVNMIASGRYYPCLIGWFELKNYKGATNLYVSKQMLSQSCLLQKSISSFYCEKIQQCPYYVQNLIITMESE